MRAAFATQTIGQLDLKEQGLVRTKHGSYPRIARETFGRLRR